jgi:hypothetical protein
MKGLLGKLKVVGIVLAVLVVIGLVAGGGKKDGSSSSSEAASSQSVVQEQSAVGNQSDVNNKVEDSAKKDTDTAKSSFENLSSAANSVVEAAVTPEFKQAMDAYEAFFDDYVDFMKRYKADPTNMDLLNELSEMTSKEATMLKEFDDWNSKGMNYAEAAYYLVVHSRIYAKLSEIQ